VGQPHFLNRLYAAKNEKTAMMAVAIAGIIFVPFFISTNWVALAGRVLLPDIANPDRIYPILVTQMLPPIVAAMILAAIMGGVMSTADSILLTASTTICRDFYQVLINPNAKPPQLLKLTRITVLIVGIGGFIFAMWYPTFATIMNMYVFGAAAATFFCPLVAAFYWKRATTTGVIASLIVGAGTTILWISMKNPYVHSSIAGIGRRVISMAKSKQYVTGLWITIIGGLLLLVGVLIGLGSPRSELQFVFPMMLKVVFAIGALMIIVGGTLWGIADSQ
jgi:Na+/pantothenate symporter